MIVVKVELHSARTGKVTEVGRLLIANDGTGTPRRGNYTGVLLRRGSTKRVQRTARLLDYPRQSYTVWEFVRRMLNALHTKSA